MFHFTGCPNKRTFRAWCSLPPSSSPSLTRPEAALAALGLGLLGGGRLHHAVKVRFFGTPCRSMWSLINSIDNDSCFCRLAPSLSPKAQHCRMHQGEGVFPALSNPRFKMNLTCSLNSSNAIDDMNSKLRDRPFSANVNVLSCNNVMIVGQFSLKLATCRTPKHYRYGLSSFRGWYLFAGCRHLPRWTEGEESSHSYQAS